ncbi:MAG: hypothetical protein H6656_22665 [Ardenticatenaceae bacterium]|nr:hypothetical protein [Ardenticatenaceae bacterium]
MIIRDLTPYSVMTNGRFCAPAPHNPLAGVVTAKNGRFLPLAVTNSR